MTGFTYRLLLAHVLPGMVPATVAVAWWRRDHPLLEEAGIAELLSLALLAAVIFGVCIDAVRRRMVDQFIGWLNIDTLLHPLKVWWWRLCPDPEKECPMTFQEQSDRYDKGLADVMAAAYQSGLRWRESREGNWMESLGEKPEKMLRYLFGHETLTVGDWWALVTVRAPTVVRFYADEYMAFEEMACNFFWSLLLSGPLLIVLWWSGVTGGWETLSLFAIGLILAAGCSYAGKFMLLAGRRYQVKVVLFLLTDPTTPAAVAEALSVDVEKA